MKWRSLVMGAALVATFGPAAAASAGGAEVFAARCAVCHLPDAQGTPGFVPPLTQTLGHYVASEEGRALLPRIVTYGMRGTITVGGVGYASSMAVYQPMSDQEIADALNHVLTRYNAASLPADFKAYTAEEVARLRAAKATPTETYAARQALVEQLKTAGKGR